jgi:hypothetical protein
LGLLGSDDEDDEDDEEDEEEDEEVDEDEDEDEEIEGDSKAMEGESDSEDEDIDEDEEIAYSEVEGELDSDDDVVPVKRTTVNDKVSVHTRGLWGRRDLRSVNELTRSTSDHFNRTPWSASLPTSKPPSSSSIL